MIIKEQVEEIKQYVINRLVKNENPFEMSINEIYTLFRTLIFSSFLLAAFIDCSFAQVEAPYEVGTWGNFCEAAISHTFDDGTANQFSIAMPLFDEKGYKMTFATVTSGEMFPGWDILNEAFANGHEIASHSVTHSGTVNEDEMRRSQEAIKENVPGEMCISMIYPYGSVPNEADVLKYYIAGRVLSGGPEGPTPANFLRIASQVVGQGGAQTDMDSYARSAVNKNGWAVYLHHGVDGDHSWAYTSSSSLRSHLDFLDANRDIYWEETFGNVVRYIKERNAADVRETSSDDNSFTVEVTDDLADSIFNYPLSIRRPLPEGWDEEDVSVTQNGSPIAHAVVTEGPDTFIMFQAVPDKGDVVISSGAIAIRCGLLRNSKIGEKIFQFRKNQIFIKIVSSGTTRQLVRFFNFKGQLVSRYFIDDNTENR